MKHNTFHFLGCLGCHACWAVVQAIINLVFAGHMIIQKEGVFTSFKHSWRVLFRSWKDELQSWLWSSHSIRVLPEDPLFWDFFLVSLLSLSYISFQEYWSCTFTPGFHSGNVYIQFIQGLEFSLMYFPSKTENSLQSRTLPCPICYILLEKRLF